MWEWGCRNREAAAAESESTRCGEGGTKLEEVETGERSGAIGAELALGEESVPSSLDGGVDEEDVASCSTRAGMAFPPGKEANAEPAPANAEPAPVAERELVLAPAPAPEPGPGSLWMSRVSMDVGSLAIKRADPWT